MSQNHPRPRSAESRWAPARAAQGVLLAAALGGGAALADPPSPAAEIERISAAVVGVRAEVPDSARTARALGTERIGSGTVIDGNGLVVTIGYLIMEAARVELLLPAGGRMPAEILAYDHETGFGLLRAIQPLGVRPLALGDSAAVREGEPVLVTSFGGRNAVRPAVLVSRREFAGYWEYLLEDALFTSPPHPFFGGAALVGVDGRLIGVGSLAVGDAHPGRPPSPGNMFLPVDTLKEVMADLLTSGRSALGPRPWLGVNTREAEGRLLVQRVSEDGPAARAGLRPGDVIVAVGGEPVDTLAAFYRNVWARGGPGEVIPLTVIQAGVRSDVAVRSGDRYGWLRLDPSL
jgi:S1-C subfamily serine protease